MINVSIAGIGGQGSVLCSPHLGASCRSERLAGAQRGNHRHGATWRRRYVSRAYGKCR